MEAQGSLLLPRDFLEEAVLPAVPTCPRGAALTAGSRGQRRGLCHIPVARLLPAASSTGLAYTTVAGPPARCTGPEARAGRTGLSCQRPPGGAAVEATCTLRRQPARAAPPNPQGGRGAVGHLRCCTGPAHPRLGAHLSPPRPPGSCPRHQLSGRCGSHAPARRVRQRPKRAQRGAGTRGRRPLGRRTGELSSASAQRQLLARPRWVSTFRSGRSDGLEAARSWGARRGAGRAPRAAAGASLSKGGANAEPDPAGTQRPPPARAWGDRHRFKIHFLLIFLCIMECLFFAEMR